MPHRPRSEGATSPAAKPSCRIRTRGGHRSSSTPDAAATSQRPARPRRRLRRAVRAADRAPRARGRASTPRSCRTPITAAEVAAQEPRRHRARPAGRPASTSRVAPSLDPGDPRARRARPRHLLRLPGHGAAARRRGRATPGSASTASTAVTRRRRAGHARCSAASPSADRLDEPRRLRLQGARGLRGPRQRPPRLRSPRSRPTERRIYGVQWHPEVKHSEFGQRVLENFLHDAAGIPADWNSGNVIAEQVDRIRAQVGTGKVICGLSGGVDSAVAAAHRAQGRRRPAHLRLRRPRAAAAGRARARSRRTTSPPPACASSPSTRVEQFLDALAGVTDPEQKRKIIGREFIRSFETRRRGDSCSRPQRPTASPISFLVQGTLYPDVVESGGGTGTANIKSHHNVGGLPEDLQFELVEPLRTLFKDEVRAIGRELGLARGHRRAPAVPRARPRHPHRRRGHPRASRAAARRPTRSCAPS